MTKITKSQSLKKAVFFSAFLTLIFFNRAHAMTPYGTLDGTAPISAPGGYLYLKLGTGLSGTLSNFSFRINTSFGIADMRFGYYTTKSDYDNDVLGNLITQGNDCDTGDQTLAGLSNSSTSTIAGSCFGSPVFNGSRYYTVYFQPPTGVGASSPVWNIYGFANSGTAFGQQSGIINAYPSGTTYRDTTTSTPGFVLGGITGPDAMTSPTVGASFVTPPATSTVTSTALSDFGTWDLSLSGLSTSTRYDFAVEYSSGSLFPSRYDFRANFTPATSSLVLSIPKTSLLASGFLGVNYIWNATATVFIGGSATDTVVTSVNFLIGSPDGSILGVGGSPTGTSTVPTTCDQTSGFFDSSLCKILAFLFSPSSRSMDSFKALGTDFKNKPPIGYLVAFDDALNGLAVGTSSIVLMNATATTAFAPVVGSLRTGTTWLFWFLLLWWAIGRFKHFNP